MASITRGPNGRRTLQFVGADGKRRSIRLGRCDQRTAESIKVRVELLNAANIAGHVVDASTLEWLTTIGDDLAAKLVRVGLAPRCEAATLQAFLDGYLESRTDLKVRTRWKLQTTRQRLIDFFGPATALRDISPGHADEFRLYLVKDGLGENSVRKHVGIAKQFFRAALRKRLIVENPFAGLKASVLPNRERFYFVSREEVRKVLDACPDPQWRLLVALARFGGLRIPSEALSLKWADVNWAENKILVRSVKTEHHGADKATRTIPLFPELAGPLSEVFEQAEPGTEYVITRYRDNNANLRTQLERIIRKAGLEPWEKPWQNCRSTRATELEGRFPSHVVRAWLGHSEAVAAKFYLQVTNDHFAEALKPAPEEVQNPVQQPAEFLRNRSPGVRFSAECEALQPIAYPPVAAVGLEPTTRGL